MKEKILSEIILTTEYVEPKAWLSLLNAISKLNGLFKHWTLYAKIELNEVHFFCETRCILPPIINSLGYFMIKKLDITKEDLMDFSNKKAMPFLLTNKEKNILDIFDKIEASRKQELKLAKM